MLKILCKRGEIAPEEQFLLLSTIFCYLMLDLYVKSGIRFSLRDKRLLEITRVDCTRRLNKCLTNDLVKLLILKTTEPSFYTTAPTSWVGPELEIRGVFDDN